MFGGNKELRRQVEQYTNQYSEILLGIHSDLNLYKKRVEELSDRVRTFSGYSDDELNQLAQILDLSNQFKINVSKAEKRINKLEASLNVDRSNLTEDIRNFKRLEFDVVKINHFIKRLQNKYNECEKNISFLAKKNEDNEFHLKKLTSEQKVFITKANDSSEKLNNNLKTLQDEFRTQHSSIVAIHNRLSQNDKEFDLISRKTNMLEKKVETSDKELIKLKEDNANLRDQLTKQRNQSLFLIISLAIVFILISIFS